MSNFKFRILMTRFLVAHRKVFYEDPTPARLEKCDLIFKKWLAWRKRVGQ